MSLAIADAVKSNGGSSADSRLTDALTHGSAGGDSSPGFLSLVTASGRAASPSSLERSYLHSLSKKVVQALDATVAQTSSSSYPSESNITQEQILELFTSLLSETRNYETRNYAVSPSVSATNMAVAIGKTEKIGYPELTGHIVCDSDMPMGEEHSHSLQPTPYRSGMADTCICAEF